MSKPEATLAKKKKQTQKSEIMSFLQLYVVMWSCNRYSNLSIQMVLSIVVPGVSRVSTWSQQ